jgi:hypothetical protein
MTFQSILTAGYAEVRRAKTNRDKNVKILLIEIAYFLLNVLIFVSAFGLFCTSTTYLILQRISRLLIVIVAPLLMAAVCINTEPPLISCHKPALTMTCHAANG